MKKDRATLSISITKDLRTKLIELARLRTNEFETVSASDIVRTAIKEHFERSESVNLLNQEIKKDKPTVVVNPFAEEDEQGDESPEETDEDFYRNNKSA